MDAPRKKIIFLLIVAILGIVIAEFIRLKVSSRMLDEVSQPLGLFSLALVVISIILFPLKESFRSWKKFALWYIPLSAILIALTSDRNHFLTPIDREIVTWWTAGGFVVISILLILHTAWRGKTKV